MSEKNEAREIICRYCRIIKPIPSKEDPTICEDCYSIASMGEAIRSYLKDYSKPENKNDLNHILYEKAKQFKELKERAEKDLKTLYVLEKELLKLMKYKGNYVFGINDLCIIVKSIGTLIIDQKGLRKNYKSIYMNHLKQKKKNIIKIKKRKQ